MICTLNEIIQALNNGEVVGIPTDTVYGFAVLKEYVSKIYELKNRDESKKLITFISSTKEIGKLDEFTDDELNQISKNYWPGNNTLIFLQNEKLVSYRIPKELNTINLLEILNNTLLTTSANISGEPPCLTQDEFIRRFPNIKLLQEQVKSERSNKPSNVYIIKKEKIEKIR